MPAQLYAGLDTPTAAALTLGGITYRCTVWIDIPSRSVWSRCMRVQDNGDEIEVFKTLVWTTVVDFGPDSTKICVGVNASTFVVHWLEGNLENDVPANPIIRRATLDMNTYGSFPNWADRGILAVETFQHDLQPIGGTTDFLVAYTSPGPVVTGRRGTGTTWGAVAWTTPASGGHTIALRAIACYGDDDDGDAVFVFESTVTPNRIFCTRLDVDTGGGTATVQSFTGLPTAYLWQAGFARLSATVVGLVCEVSTVAEVTYAIPILAKVRLVSATAVPGGDEQWEHHLRMLGQPFAFAGARETAQDPSIYVLSGYKNATDAAEFAQQNAFVLNLDAQNWGAGGGDQTVRPRQVCTFNFGDVDCRVSGSTPDGGALAGFGVGRRLGNIPAASAAPERGRAMKTRGWAVLGFSKLMAMSSSGEAPLQPVAATIQVIRFQVEEPWQLHRDPSEPANPTECFKGNNPFSVGVLREAGFGALIGGGTPSYYDRHGITEVGFSWYPEILVVQDNGAGQVLAGTYQYVVTWEHRDGIGQMHRSAPAQIVSFTTANLRQIEVRVGSLTLSLRDNAFHYPDTTGISAVLWRTTAGGIVFYRVYAQRGAVNRPEDTPINDPTVGYFSTFDNVDDADLVLQEPLPYQLLDGVFTPLPPFQPPAFSAIAKWQNRIFGASSQDPRLLFFSQEILNEPGGTRPLAPEFHPNLVVRIDGVGRLMAMQETEHEFFIFTTDATYSVTGFGPDAAGNNSSYQLSVVQTGVGCIDQRSTVLTRLGVFFQSMHGIELQQPGGQIEHVALGEKVRDTIEAGGNLRAATFMQDRDEVIWVTNGAPSGEPLLVALDLKRLQWSTRPLALGDQPGGSDVMSAAAGGTVWTGRDRNIHHVVVQQGALLIERADQDAAPYADEDRNSTDPVPMVIEVNPIHLDGIDGYVRVNRLVIALEKPSASGVRVIFYSWRKGAYSTAVTETKDFASPAEPRITFRPRHQKCAAFWYRIEELATVPATENIKYLGAHVKVGVKKSLRQS